MNELPPPVASSSPDGRAAGDIRIGRDDGDYPESLLDLGPDAPDPVWARGSLSLLETRPCVAIVGTRLPTPYGERVARELATAFARAGACVVSGLARGIDGTAHRAALDVGGATIAVLGTGLDHVFPKSHRVLQRVIGERGLLLSELEAHEHGMPFSFPRRNRIIAALSSLTIVVQAGHKSGALTTADHANGLGRLVAAVPGPIDLPQSAGSNWLLGNTAHVIGSIEDALALVGLTPPPRVPRGDPQGDEGRVWAALADGALDLDTLCHRSGLPAARCMAAVTKLEITGSLECALTGEIRRR
jgi:DNA processing protein